MFVFLMHGPCLINAWTSQVKHQLFDIQLPLTCLTCLKCKLEPDHEKSASWICFQVDPAA